MSRLQQRTAKLPKCSRLRLDLPSYRRRARTAVQPLLPLPSSDPPRRPPLPTSHARLRQHSVIRKALGPNSSSINLHGIHPSVLNLSTHPVPIPRTPTHPPRLPTHPLPVSHAPLLPLERLARPIAPLPRQRTLHAPCARRPHAPQSTRENIRPAAPPLQSPALHGARKRRHGRIPD